MDRSVLSPILSEVELRPQLKKSKGPTAENILAAFQQLSDSLWGNGLVANDPHDSWRCVTVC